MHHTTLLHSFLSLAAPPHPARLLVKDVVFSLQEGLF